MRLKGVYFDARMSRHLNTYPIAGTEFTLTSSQHLILQKILFETNKQSDKATVIPLFIESETGTGKTQLAISASVSLFKHLSANFNRIHSIYLSPTTLLAAQASERFSIELQKHIPNLKMVSIRGLDEDKHEKVRDVFSIYLNSTKAMLSTNPQFLASLATKNSKFYRLEKRSSEFELIKTFTDANLLIVDEVHFYEGKSVVRLLTLLLTIMQFKRMSVTTPTIILFLSASMSSPGIDTMLYHLNKSLELGVSLTDMNLNERTLKIEERERGEKWVQFLEAENFEDFYSFLLEKVADDSYTTVVFWDSIPRLVQIQELFRDQGIEAAIYHSQMPRELQQENLKLLSDGAARVLLTTSVSEIGIEFESLNFRATQMFSVNTKQLSKIVQRLGRLARRKETTGTFYAVDFTGALNSLSDKFSNGLSYQQGSTDYPSLLEMAQNFTDSFFTGYISPKADAAFSLSLNKAVCRTTGEVFPIYISNSVRVEKMPSNIIDEIPDTKEPLYFPYWRLSAGAFKIAKDQYLEFSKHQGAFHYQLRYGIIQTKPFIVTTVTPEEDGWKRQRRSGLQSEVLKAFWTRWKMLTARFGKATITHTIPGNDSKHLCSELIRLEFEGEVFPKDHSFLECPFYEDLLELIHPLEHDLEFYWKGRQEINDHLYCFEPESGTERHPLALGAVEKLWTVLTGEKDAA